MEASGIPTMLGRTLGRPTRGLRPTQARRSRLANLAGLLALPGILADHGHRAVDYGLLIPGARAAINAALAEGFLLWAAWTGASYLVRIGLAPFALGGLLRRPLGDHADKIEFVLGGLWAALVGRSVYAMVFFESLVTPGPYAWGETVASAVILPLLGAGLVAACRVGVGRARGSAYALLPARPDPRGPLPRAAGGLRLRGVGLSDAAWNRPRTAQLGSWRTSVGPWR